MRTLRRFWKDGIAIAVAVVVFVVPFIYIFLMSAKDQADAARRQFSLPKSWHLWENLQDVLDARDGMALRAIKNSIVLTVLSVTFIVLLGAMIGFMLDRRRDRLARAMNVFMLAGLIIPPAIVPTIFTLQKLHLFKTMPGLIAVEVTFFLPYSILLFKAFASTIPRELDEAAFIDGCSGSRLFFKVVLPLLRPAMITVIVTSSVAIYNDFTNPLYFLPGADNATAQSTLFSFQSQFKTQWNLLFMDVILITIPPLIAFIFFNRKIVDGMTSGAIKG